MLLTVPQVAERLNISPSAVYQLIEAGKLGHHRIGIGRGTIRVSEADLGAFLCESHRDAREAALVSAASPAVPAVRPFRHLTLSGGPVLPPLEDGPDADSDDHSGH